MSTPIKVNASLLLEAFMPLVIYIFTISAFALGLAEFVPIGLTDVMAHGLGASASNRAAGRLRPTRWARQLPRQYSPRSRHPGAVKTLCW